MADEHRASEIWTYATSESWNLFVFLCFPVIFCRTFFLIHSFIQSGSFCRASSIPLLLRGAIDTARKLEFHVEAPHRPTLLLRHIICTYVSLLYRYNSRKYVSEYSTWITEITRYT